MGLISEVEALFVFFEIFLNGGSVIFRIFKNLNNNEKNGLRRKKKLLKER